MNEIRGTMSIQSMTGFAREEGSHDAYSWRWELRSVNNRGLDVRVRLPSGMESFEIRVRDSVGRQFKRGSFNISLNLTETPGLVGYRLNEALLDRVIEIAEMVRGRTQGAPPSAEGLLRLRGVLEPEEPAADDESRRALENAMADSLEAALKKVAETRKEEGARLDSVLKEFLGEIAELAAQARDLAATQPEAISARIRSQLEELVGNETTVPEERLAQEIALIVGKADLREEIDRLDAHAAQAREVMAAGGAIGRRLDFLSQEFNREANTLCSKAQDLELTRTGLALKAVIEQFREQVQNIE
ncbi:MAG TPA: YicC/YloC family endoribonuclease [Alphaproteobacteria bacterium]|nr:YicC/YloC family endoribonuclease [Alphaproteobacteria bacterium]